MRIYFKTFGCRVNQIETQSLLEAAERAGHEIVSGFEEAQLAVVNSCSVTGAADKDCLRLLRVISRRNPECRILATGCIAAVMPEKIRENASAAEIIPNSAKRDIPARFFGAVSGEGFGWKISAHRGHSRAFVKIQDGCAGSCNYCLVRLARPDLSSKPLPETLEELAGLVGNGYGELVLSGINIGNYKCPATGADLAGLLRAIWKLDGDFRIRLSSIEARNVDAALLDSASAGGEKFCDYFHIPLQSGSDSVLKAMGRDYDAAFYLRAVESVRGKWPGAGIYADVIAGYPAETQKDFEAGLEFIESARLAGLHVFSFSPRPGTPAEKLKQLLPEAVRERAEKLRALDKQLRCHYAGSLVNTAQRVVVEECPGGFNGLAGNFVEVALSGEKPAGAFAKVKILSAAGGKCRGEIIPEIPGN